MMVDDDIPIAIENDSVRLTQVNWLADTHDDMRGTATGTINGDEYNGGRAQMFGSQFAEVGDSISFTFQPEHFVQNAEIYIRQDSDVDNPVVPGMKIGIEGALEFEIDDGGSQPVEGLDWVGAFGGLAELNAGETYTFSAEITKVDHNTYDYDRWYWDVVSIVDNDYELELNFDNQVHEPEGYLDGPELFLPDGIWVESSESLANTNITNARLNVDVDDHLMGNQKLQMSFDQGESYFPNDGTENNTQSIDVDSSTTGLSVNGRMKMSAYPLNSSDGTPQNKTPRFGYNGHSLNSWTFDVDTDDLEILFNQEFNDNRLATISNLADSSNQFFRWEGDVCRIFRQGEEKTNVELKEENITSTTDIEDTYSSVQVKGRGGIESPVIESDNAPSYVNRHKEIRDRDIESEQDARRRAIEFITDNGEIIFEGDINTLPTRAPLGEEMDGEIFSHGKDMFIERVNYSKRSSSISLGRRRDLGKEIMQLERSKRSSEILDTT